MRDDAPTGLGTDDERQSGRTVQIERVGRMRTGLLEAGARPVSGASVAIFRIAFGIAMVADAFMYLPWLVRQYYVDTSFHFSYGPFTFVAPLNGIGMHLVYVAMIVTGVLIALGLWYRWAAAAFFVVTTYVFLLDSTFYQNHEYLISLLAFMLIFLPLDRMWSLDARRRPDLASSTVPAWVLWLLRFQIAVPYFFGGIAKLNPDWLRGEPLRMWLGRRTDIEIIGPLLSNEAVVWFMVYGSLILDLVVVGLLLYRRTRVAAFVVAVVFHLLNARLFGLFIFPWLMIAATTLFFPPEWPFRVQAWWRGRRQKPPVPTPAMASAPADSGRSTRQRMAPALATFLALWVAVQVLVPLRHLAIPGYASWTEEGHRFAWHMMLREKQGTSTFILTADGETWEVDPADHLSPKQVSRLAGRPDRLARFAHHLSDLYDGAEVRVETSVALNGRDPVPIVDPTVDLASVPVPWWGHADWILPLEEPLRRD